MFRIHDCTVHSSQENDLTTRVLARSRPDLKVNAIGGVLAIPSVQQATAGPGPSTSESRARRTGPTLPNLDRHPSTNDIQLETVQSSTRTRHEEGDLDDLENKLRKLVGRKDVMEITDELTESTVMTRLLTMAGEEQDWIEVDDMLDVDNHIGQNSDTPMSIPSIPHESRSDDQAIDPTRLQLVLKTITRRIMKRRRTIQRRTPASEEVLERPSPKTPNSTPDNSPESSSSSPHVSPSKRSSPFKGLLQVKAAVARRLHFGTSSPRESIAEVEMAAMDPETEEREDTCEETATLGAPPSIAESRTSRESVEEETPGSLFPHDDLVVNIHRFMRYSSAAYGVSLSIRLQLKRVSSS
jgi:hypothetical protein